MTYIKNTLRKYSFLICLDALFLRVGNEPFALTKMALTPPPNNSCRLSVNKLFYANLSDDG